MKKRRLKRDGMLELLRSRCDAAGAVSRWAKRNGIAVRYVYDVLAEKTPLGPKIAGALGFSKLEDEWEQQD